MIYWIYQSFQGCDLQFSAEAGSWCERLCPNYAKTWNKLDFHFSFQTQISTDNIKHETDNLETLCYLCSLVGLTSCDCDNAVEAGFCLFLGQCLLSNVYVCVILVSHTYSFLDSRATEWRYEWMASWDLVGGKLVSTPSSLVDAASDSAGTSS